MKKYIKYLPNVVTLMGVVCGWLAILALVNGWIGLAVRLNMLAIVFDFADGYLARRWAAESALGRNLDSLGDVIIYSLFDAILCLRLFEQSAITAGLSSLIIICGVYRLARFTDEGLIVAGKKMYYSGLSVAHFSLIFIFLSGIVKHTRKGEYLFVGVSIILALMMVSRIRVRKIAGILPAAALLILLSVVSFYF